MTLSQKQLAAAGIAALLGFLAYRQIFTKEGRRKLNVYDLLNDYGAVYDAAGEYVRCEQFSTGKAVADTLCQGRPDAWTGAGY